MNIRIYNLGCRLNQYEIQSIATDLKERGHKIVKDDSYDLVLINTCIVTKRSEGKTRNLINRAKNKVKKNTKVIVTGCFANQLKIDGDIFFITNDYKYLIPELVENHDLFYNILDSEPSRFDYTAPFHSNTTRVNLKIQDGCDNFCSFCIIPHVRGVPQSKPYSSLIKEFEVLRDAGYKEIVLTGISIGKYHSENKNLGDLIEDLLNINGEYRIHLSSLDPGVITDKIIGLLDHDKMVKHIHLSLQSGSNKILKSMNRTYTQEEYLDIIQDIRNRNPQFNFTTDVIVGFPGELEKDYQDTINVVNLAGFSHIHTFRYSPRPFTKAYDLPDVPEKIKKERSRRLIEISANQRKIYLSQFHNKITRFLSEEIKDQKTYGLNDYYVPIEIEKKIHINSFISVSSFFCRDKNKLTGVPIN